MIGDDVNDIDYNESGLTIFLKAINSRFYPLDVSRGTTQAEFTKGGRKYKTIKVDKYPLLADTHPTVIENGRYYQFDVDVTDLDDDGGPVDPTGIIKLIALPYDTTQVNFRFTLDGDVSPEFPNMDQFTQAASVWAEENGRMFALTVIPLGSEYPNIAILIAGSAHTTAKPIFTIENLTEYDFVYGAEVQTSIDIMVNAVTSGIPNLLVDQMKKFTSGEFTGTYTREMTYVAAPNEENPGISCANATTELSVMGILNSNATVPLADFVIADFATNTFLSGVTSTPQELVAAGISAENINNPDVPNSAGFRIRNIADENKVIGVTFLPVNQDQFTNIALINNPAALYDPLDGYYKGCVLSSASPQPEVCPATVNQFDWYSMSQYDNLRIWLDDQDIGLFADYYNGNTAHADFYISPADFGGGTIYNARLDCLKLMIVDPTNTWDPRDTDSFQTYMNDEDVNLIYGAHGFTFHLSPREANRIEIYTQLITNGWTTDAVVGGSEVEVSVTVSGDFVATEGQPTLTSLDVTVDGQTQTVATSFGVISHTLTFNVIAPDNVDPSMNAMEWDLQVTTNYSDVFIGNSVFPVLTQLLNTDTTPTLGIGETYPVGYMQPSTGWPRTWDAGGYIVGVQQKVVIQMDASYANLTLKIDPTGSIDGDVLGVFDGTGRIEFDAPRIVLAVTDQYIARSLYIYDENGYVNAQFFNLNFDVTRPILLTADTGEVLTEWATSVGVPYPAVKFILPGVTDSSQQNINIAVARPMEIPLEIIPLNPYMSVNTVTIDDYWEITNMRTPTQSSVDQYTMGLRISATVNGVSVVYHTPFLNVKVNP